MSESLRIISYSCVLGGWESFRLHNKLVKISWTIGLAAAKINSCDFRSLISTSTGLIYIFHDENLAFVKWHIAFKHFSVVLRGRKNMHRNQEKNNELVEFQSWFHSVFLSTIHYWGFTNNFHTPTSFSVTTIMKNNFIWLPLYQHIQWLEIMKKYEMLVFNT